MQKTKYGGIRVFWHYGKKTALLQKGRELPCGVDIDQSPFLEEWTSSHVPMRSYADAPPAPCRLDRITRPSRNYRFVSIRAKTPSRSEDPATRRGKSMASGKAAFPSVRT